MQFEAISGELKREQGWKKQGLGLSRKTPPSTRQATGRVRQIVFHTSLMQQQLNSTTTTTTATHGVNEYSPCINIGVGVT